MSNVQERFAILSDEMEVQKEALNIATGKVNSLEEEQTDTRAKLVKYSNTIGVLRKQLKASPVTDSISSSQLKELRKQLSESNERARHLAAQVSKMESSNSDDGESIESKYKSVNNFLTSKIKALKKAEGDLRKAESSVKKLTDSINVKDKKITELENCN